MPAPSAIDEVLQLMAKLRDPENGCAWDLRQDFHSIAPYTIEEAYEVADAIMRQDLDSLREELGDLLLQVVFHARMAEEQEAFDFNAVAYGLAEKLRRRHPHVFGQATAYSAEEVDLQWEHSKARERAHKGEMLSAMDDIPLALPALKRAQKIQRRASRVGFDWRELAPVLAKFKEEIAELEQVLTGSNDADNLFHELGDILFSVVNLARHLELDSEAALSAANQRFSQRFRYIEATLAARGERVAQTDSKQLNALWEEAKTKL